MNTIEVANPLKSLRKYGQSIWLDYVRRNLLVSGSLDKMVQEDGLCGVTSNPAIFEKAIAGSNDYDAELKELTQKETDPVAIYEQLAIEDIQQAADILKPVYVETKAKDGYVSLEVSPLLAKDTKKTIEEAIRLWKRVNRPNVMIKVPATEEGVPAIETLIGQGININVTLLFAQESYKKVAEAYIKGLQTFAASGGDLSKVASVASFFVSRIDSAIDSQIEKRLQASPAPEEAVLLKGTLGKVAIANAKLTYQIYKKLYSQERWLDLAKNGAHPQRLLWASTGTKNAAYSDVLYVEELIGPDTVNTLPPATLDAFRDHGKPSATLETELGAALNTMAGLQKLGISMEDVCAKLIEDGVKLFADAYEKLIEALKKKSKL